MAPVPERDRDIARCECVGHEYSPNRDADDGRRDIMATLRKCRLGFAVLAETVGVFYGKDQPLTRRDRLQFISGSWNSRFNRFSLWFLLTETVGTLSAQIDKIVCAALLPTR